MSVAEKIGQVSEEVRLCVKRSEKCSTKTDIAYTLLKIATVLFSQALVPVFSDLTESPKIV